MPWLLGTAAFQGGLDIHPYLLHNGWMLPLAVMEGPWPLVTMRKSNPGHTRNCSPLGYLENMWLYHGLDL